MTPRPPGSDQIARLRWVIAQLRAHCPWTRELTHEDLTEYLVEEAYEVLEEIEAGSLGEGLRREMGDLLFQVALHSQLAEERGSFDLDGVAEAITAKLVRRSPHVFTADGQLAVDTEATVAQIETAWTRIKAQEKAEQQAAQQGEQRSPQETVKEPEVTAGGDDAGSHLAGVVGSLPAHLPALARAAKVIDRLGRDSGEHLIRGGSAPPAAADEDELGELLFAVVHTAREHGQDPERALRNHLRKLT